MVKGFIFPVEYIHKTGVDAIRIGISQPLIDRIAYNAGQYLTLKVNIEGQDHFRSYSLSSAPRLDSHLEIAVKRLRGGLVSNYLHDHLKVGDTIECMRPAGRFFVEAATQMREHIILIGGGSGITPLFSILRSVLFHSPYSQVSLLYQNRSLRDIMFKAELDELSSKFSDRLHLKHFLSQPATESLPDDMRKERLNAHLVKDWCDKRVSANSLPARFFLCGPLGMMRAAKEGLQAAGIKDAAIHQEKFVADEEITARQQSWAGPTRTVQITLGEKIYTVKVSPGSTILEAGIQQGLSLPYSCKRGICSSCMSRLEAGLVEMDNPESLLEFEIEQGRVLLCQAHPLGDDVQIRVGF